MTRRKVPLINPGNEYGGNEAGIQLALIRGSVTEVNLADLDQCSERLIDDDACWLQNRHNRGGCVGSKDRRVQFWQPRDHRSFIVSRAKVGPVH